MTNTQQKDAPDFWQEHSEQFLIMAFDSEKRGKLAHPDGYGKRTGACGDTVEIFLAIKDNIITGVTFDLQGCLNTSACANTVATLAEGKSVEAAWSITPEIVAAYLQTLPADHFHCAELAVGAFYLALTDYRHHQYLCRPA